MEVVQKGFWTKPKFASFVNSLLGQRRGRQASTARWAGLARLSAPPEVAQALRLRPALLWGLYPGLDRGLRLLLRCANE